MQRSIQQVRECSASPRQAGRPPAAACLPLQRGAGWQPAALAALAQRRQQTPSQRRALSSHQIPVSKLIDALAAPWAPKLSLLSLLGNPKPDVLACGHPRPRAPASGGGNAEAAAARLMPALVDGGPAAIEAVAASGVRAVARLLHSSSASLVAKESAVTLVCTLVDSNAERQAIFTAAGAVPLLVRLLRGTQGATPSGGAALAPLVTTALHLLASACEAAARDISAEGGVPLLVRCLSPPASDMFGLGQQVSAAQALGCVAAAGPPLAQAMADAGANQLLVRNLRSAHPDVAATATEALWKLALSGGLALRRAMAAAGAPAQLVRCLRSVDASVLEHAAAALANVADGEPGAAEATVAAGGLPLLLPLLRLRHGSAAVQVAAV